MFELIDLTKRYGPVLALDDVSLTVEPGHIHGFVGRNGAGKTTTMRIALGLAEPDEGQVHWQDRPVTAADRRMFGYMPEERGLYPKMSALDQVAFFGRLSGMAEADAAVAARRELTSLGLEEWAGEAVEQLSLGNQQRVQLAAAMVQSSALLVLDEPFSGLGPVGVGVLSGVLRAQVGKGPGWSFPAISSS